MIKHKLKLLDDILSSLEKSKTHSLSEEEIYEKCMSTYTSPKFKTGKLLAYSDPKDELKNILTYLEEENLIEGKNANSYFEIRYNGILKLANGGFLGEFNSQNWKNRLNTFFWWGTPTAAFVSLILTALRIFGVI